MAAPVILVEASPRNAADGSAVTVRLAGGGADVPYHYGGQHWRAGIVGLPNSVSSLDFDGEQLGGGGVAQALELRWAPGSNAALAELAALFWTDAPIVVRIGAEGEAMPPVETTGLVLETAIDGGVLRIALADNTADLKRPLLVDRYAGTGGIEGPVEFEGAIKPRAWGRCFNVPGRLLVPASNIWVFGDPRRPWQAFDQVRTQGVAPDAEDMSVLAWQGSAEATLAALDASAPIAGGGIKAPSIACVKWWAEAPDLRADIRGETAGGYVESAPAIAARIVAARSSLGVAVGAIAAAAAARPAPCGWRVESEGATAAAEISALLAGVSLSWMIVDDVVEFRAWDWTASTRSVRSEGVTRRQIYKPVATRRLGYRRNWSPMARGDLAAVVLARDVVYEGDISLEEAIASAGQTADWDQVADPTGTKPDDNATRGSPAGTIVGDRLAEQVAADLDLNALNHLAEATLAGTWREQSDQIIYAADGRPIRTVVEQLGSTVDGIDIFVTELQEVNASAGTAKFLFAARGDGTIVGIEGIAGGGFDLLAFMASRFVFVDNSGANPVQALAYEGGVWKLKSIEVDTLKADTVETKHLVTSSVQKNNYVILGSDVACPANVDVAVMSVAFTKAEADSLVRVQASAMFWSTDDLQFQPTFVVDGSTAYSAGEQNIKFSESSSAGKMSIAPAQMLSGIPAGDHTIAFHVVNVEGSGDALTVKANSFLEAVELKRAAI